METITDSNLNEFVNNQEKLPAFLDLWAEWCMPCRKTEPIVKELEKEYSGRLLFGKLNTDENQETTGKFRVSSIPMFLIFNRGTIIDSFIGAQPKEKFKKRIDEALTRIK